MQEMRLWKREIRDPGQIRRILEDCQVLHIGARDEEGMLSFRSITAMSIQTKGRSSSTSILLRMGGKPGLFSQTARWRWSWTVKTD